MGEPTSRISKSKHTHSHDGVLSAILKSSIAIAQPRYSFRDRMCYRCKKLKLRKLFQDGPPQHEPLNPPDLGTFGDIQRRTRCPFCRLLLTLIQKLVEAQPMLLEVRWSVGAITSDDVLFGYARHKNRRLITNREQKYLANGIFVNEQTSTYLGARSKHWMRDI